MASWLVYECPLGIALSRLEPWPRTLCRVLGQDTCTHVYIQAKQMLGGIPATGKHPIHGGEEIFLASRFILLESWLAPAHLGSYTDFDVSFTCNTSLLVIIKAFRRLVESKQRKS